MKIQTFCKKKMIYYVFLNVESPGVYDTVLIIDMLVMCQAVLSGGIKWVSNILFLIITI